MRYDYDSKAEEHPEERRNDKKASLFLFCLCLEKSFSLQFAWMMNRERNARKKHRKKANQVQSAIVDSGAGVLAASNERSDGNLTSLTFPKVVQLAVE